MEGEKEGTHRGNTGGHEGRPQRQFYRDFQGENEMASRIPGEDDL